MKKQAEKSHSDIYREAVQEKLRREREAEQRPLTPEERQSNLETMRRLRPQLGVKLSANANVEGVAMVCRVCKDTLPGYVKYYCSGSCLLRAQAEGSYGREEETEAQRAEREALLAALA